MDMQTLDRGTLTLTAEDTRHEGMLRVEQTAEEMHPGWKDDAVGFVREFARVNRYFMCEDIRFFAEARGFTAPASARAWGPVISAAGRKNICMKVDNGNTRNPRSHGTPAGLWESLIFEGVAPICASPLRSVGNVPSRLPDGRLPIVLPSLSLAA